MGHVIKPVLKAKPGQSATLEIPQEIKDEFDEFYEYLRQHPTEEGMVEFDQDGDSEEAVKALKAEMNRFANQFRVYGRTREAGAVKFRQLPSKHLPANMLRFQLSADLPENGERASQPGPVSETPATTPKGRGKGK